MRMLIVILGAAGVAAGASAQGAGWEFTLEEAVGTAANPLRPGQETATVTLAARFDPADYAFAGATLSVHADEAGWSRLRLLPVQIPPMPPRGRPGEISGGDVTRIIVGQLHIGPFVADPSNPIPLWQAEFTVTDFSEREISLSSLTGEFRVFISPTGPTSEPRTIDEGRGVIFVIPTPAGLALLGLGGVVAARRRR